MRGKVWCLAVACWIAACSWAWADDTQELRNWRRIDSRYCTIWLHPSLDAKKVNRQISTWRVRPQVRPDKGDTEESKLAAKCDLIFRRAEEVLDMYPPGIHTNVRIAMDRSDIKETHAERFGYGTKAVSYYIFENNTIYATVKDISESVLAHEMAHCIIDHYFRVRPPRKIEELLAMHADTHLRE